MSILLTVFWVISALVIGVGSLSLVYYPLSIIAEIRSHRSRSIFYASRPLVSIIVPGFNEEKVIGNCVQSILKSTYTNYEVILVDDGSKDNTYKKMRHFLKDDRVQVFTKPNGGKAAALNLGYRQSKGEVLMFVDADGIFTPTTIQEMLKGFSNHKIGAVCGNDAPVNLDRPLTQLMSIQTHVGTSFVRRALAVLNCLPIVSGNIGAFRRSVLEKTDPSHPEPLADSVEKLWESRRDGPFREGFIGEDLELTWRVHRTGYRVAFAPRATVMAEVPSTIKGLWKQRVRWARGLLQTVGLHKDMFFNRKYWPIGLYMPVNYFNMVIVPFLQLIIVFMIVLFALAGYSPIRLDILNIILWAGLLGAVLTTVYALILDGAWRDLKYAYVLPLWIPYSLMMDVVMVWAVILEIRGTEAQWNKVDRTGVITRRALAEGKKEK